MNTPSMTPSIHVPLEDEDLQLKKVYVIYPGKERYALHSQVEALPLTVVPGLRIQELTYTIYVDVIARGTQDS